MKVHEILETAVCADDLEAARRFYGSVLGLEAFAAEAGRHVFFRCGARVFLVFRPEATLDPASPVPTHGAKGPGHVAFAVRQSELVRRKSHLADHGVEIEAEVEWPTGGKSLYLRGPAGNSVELTSPSIWNIDEALVFGAG
ncbi:MAG: VOC family protein [Planctomycetota bacterium]|jgi:catechol 2,3-dioxygenase-like lactoylglutathione lyase family enzyme